jgi:hypothetical protein
MKIKNILMVCGALFFGTVALTSCSNNDDNYDIDGDANNLIYVDQTLSNTTTCTVYHTPVGEFGEVQADINAKLQYSTQDSINVSAVVDTTLISTYNSENNTNYATLPASALSAVKVKAGGISSGTSSTSAPVEVSLPKECYSSLTAPCYVVPIRLALGNVLGSASERHVAGSKTLAIHYMIIKTTNELAYFDGTTTQTCAIVRTPLGVFGGISGNFDVSLHHALDGDVKVTAVADNSLIAAYNSEKGTDYVALPTNVANALIITPGTIAKGKTAAAPSIAVSVPNNVAKSLTEPGYILPLRLQVTYSNGTAQTVENSIAYLVVKTLESLINDNATALLGTAQSNDVAKDWTCIAAENLDKDGYSSMFGDYYSSWSFLTKKSSTASFTVDLGATHKVSGFRVSSQLMTNAEVKVSMDGITWTSLGEMSGHKAVKQREGWNSLYWYVLYAGVSARYVKVDVTLDPNSESWDYFDYGYTTMDGFGLCFDD